MLNINNSMAHQFYVYIHVYTCVPPRMTVYTLHTPNTAQLPETLGTLKEARNSKYQTQQHYLSP